MTLDAFLSLFRWISAALVIGMFFLVGDVAATRTLGLVTIVGTVLHFMTGRLSYSDDDDEAGEHLTGIRAFLFAVLLLAVGVFMLMRPRTFIDMAG